MNLAPIPDIKAELKSMYPSYRFDMKASSATSMYMITVFKDGNNLSTINLRNDVPITDAWVSIKSWMRPLLAYGYR